MAEKVAVEGNKCDHGEGAFKTPSKTSVKIGGKPVIVIDDEAYPDNNGHTDTQASTGSGKVFVYGKKLHRNNDERHCGAKTVVDTDHKVYCG